MLKILLTLYLRRLFQSTRFDTNLIFKILTAFAFLNFCIIVFFFGKSFAELLNKVHPLADPVKYLNEGLVYLIPIDFLLRFFFQKNNFTDIKSFLHLPIGRGQIISYILGIELFNIFNLYFILFLIPFAWINILPNFGLISFSLFVLNILLFLGIMTYLSFLIRNLSQKNILIALIPGLWILLVFILKTFYGLDLGKFTGTLFANILLGNYLTIFLFAVFVTLLIIRNISIVKHLIYNIFTSEDKINLTTRKSTHLSRPGNPYILLEISLMLRNKRIRSMLTIPIYITFLSYVLLIFKPINDPSTLFFWYLCLSGVWGYSYLQFVFSFESSFFDFMSTANFDFHKYLKIKYTFIVLFSLVVVLISLPILIIRNQNLYIFATAFLYNIGLGFFITLLSGTFNKSKMDLNNSLLFNYQGNNPLQIISMSIAIILPLTFIVLISSFLRQTFGLIILNIISIISLLNYNKWFRMIYRHISKRKYINLEGYRR